MQAGRAGPAVHTAGPFVRSGPVRLQPARLALPSALNGVRAVMPLPSVTVRIWFAATFSSTSVCAVRPANLQSIDLRRRAEAEVHAQIVLRQIARAGLHLAHLRRAAGRERGRGRRSRCDCSRCPPAGRARRWFPAPPSLRSSSAWPPLLVTQQIEIAVVVDVAGGERRGRRVSTAKPGPDCAADVA